jgi:hypothetical protein
VNLRTFTLILTVIAASADVRYFQYERPILDTPPKQLQTCVALDAAAFAHAAPMLSDLRLYHDGKETPYAIWFTAPAGQSARNIEPLNLGEREESVVFDAAMPEGRYADIDLNIGAQNFIATVDVSGSQAQTGGGETKLGSYTIFDFSDQKLGRSTVLHLPESDFRFLHFRIGGSVKPQQVAGLTIEAVPENKPQYATVAESAQVTQKNNSSVLEFTIPANVPVARIEFLPGEEPANFSRDVTITAEPAANKSVASEAELPETATTFTGSLLRVHEAHNGHRVDEEHLAIDTTGYTFQKAANWTITIDNGSDSPIALKSVRIEMRERTLCFEAAPGTGYTLYYGDPALSAPRYDYASLFTPEQEAKRAALGPEQSNPQYRSRPDERPFTEKHPALLWMALALVILLLGAIALRSARQLGSK